jgi:hypothetical protein
MLANIGCYVAVSLRRPARRGRDQPGHAVRRCASGIAEGERSRFWRGSAQVQDLLPLIGRFLGPGAGARGLY